jgi:hypothetical protein
MILFKTLLCVSVVALFAAMPANATPVNSLTGGIAVVFPDNGFGNFGPGPTAVTPDISWSSTNASFQGGAVFGYSGFYGFAGNGSWFGTPMAGLNTDGPTSSMTFSFANPVSGVGGELNWTDSGNASISVFDSSMTLLESFVLYDGSNNTVTPSTFFGFQRGIADISFFTLSDSFIGIRGMQVSGQVSAVPIPGALPLLATGLGAIVALRRRNKAKKAA